MFDYRYSQTRIRMGLLFSAVIVSLLLVGCGAKAPKVYQVGILGVPSFPDATTGFKVKMTELGYIEGENIVYDEYLIRTQRRKSSINSSRMKWI